MLGGRSAVDPNRVAAYIRWSTDEQGHGTTLSVQRERVGHFIRSQGWNLCEELVYIDDGYSGGSLDRPGLSRLREAIGAGLVECVVVYRLDRLSRSLLDTVNLVRREWAGRAELCSATENFDTQSPVGQMIFNILASFAEFERNMIRDRTLSGKRKRAEQGRNAGHRYPLGYRKGADGGWALDGWDPEQGRFTGPAALVRRIFEAFLGGLSTGAVARMLNAQGVPTPMGRPWRFHYIARILRNPLYAGQYRYGRARVLRARVGEGAPSIVTAEEFGRVEQRLSTRHQRSSPASFYLLTGVVRCSRCGNPVAGSRGRGKRYYVCTGRTLLHQCDCGYMDAGLLEEAVMAELRQWLGDALPAAHIESRWREAVATCQSAVREREAELAALGRRKRRLEDDYLAGKVTGDHFTDLARRLETEEREAAERLVQASDELAQLQVEPAVLRAGAERIDLWQALSAEESRQLIRLATAQMTVYQPPGKAGEATVVWCPKASRLV